MRRLLVLLGVLFAGTLLFAGPASAHATVVSSDPVDGARLKAAPKTVTITFDEQVGLGGLGYLHVTNQSGQRVESAAATHPNGDGSRISAPLPSALPDGTYTESYRVVSADSHPVAGVVRFVIGNGPLVVTPVAGGGATVNHVASVSLDLSRWISWSGLALLGGAWLLLTVWPAGRDDRRARAIVWAGWGGATLGSMLELLVQGPYSAGFGLSRMFDWSLIDDTLHTDYGQWHSGRLLLLGALGVLLGRALQPARARYAELALPLGLAIAFSFAATGHAETTNPSWLSLLLDTLHLSAMATWVGGLVLLLATVLPRRDPEEIDAVVPVFSKVAFLAITVLAVTGTYAAWRGVGSWRAFVHTEYGLLVLAKIALFCGLLAVANLSRRVVQRRLVVAYAMADSATDDAVADGAAVDGAVVDDEPQLRAERLRRSVLVEIVLAVAVLAATAVLVGQPRGSEALAAQAREPVSASASLGGGARVSVTVEPGVHGPVSIDVSVSGGSAPKSVTGTAALPAQQLGPIPLSLRADGARHYSASAVQLPVSGDWQLNLVVTASSFDAVTATVTVHLS